MKEVQEHKHAWGVRAWCNFADTFINNITWLQYDDKHVALFCSSALAFQWKVNVIFRSGMRACNVHGSWNNTKIKVFWPFNVSRSCSAKFMVLSKSRIAIIRQNPFFPPQRDNPTIPPPEPLCFWEMFRSQQSLLMCCQLRHRYDYSTTNPPPPKKQKKTLHFLCDYCILCWDLLV